MADPTPTSALLTNSAPKIRLNHAAIGWLAAISAIVALGLIVVAFLLCRCTFCSRRRRRGERRQSSFIADGRELHHYWNREVALSEAAFGGVTREGQGQKGQVRPLEKAVMRPEEWDGMQHPGRPVVVDEVGVGETYGEERRKESRYYGSGWRESAARRLSGRSMGIGKAL